RSVGRLAGKPVAGEPGDVVDLSRVRAHGARGEAAGEAAHGMPRPIRARVLDPAEVVPLEFFESQLLRHLTRRRLLSGLRALDQPARQRPALVAIGVAHE